MFEQGWAPKMSETQISNVWDEFFNGFYAFYLSGPWNIREFRKRQPPELEGQWGTMPLPGPDGSGAGIAGGTSLVLFRDSPRQAQAWKLIEFLSRPDIQQRFHAMIGDLPPRRSTWEHPALAQDEFARAFRDQLERVKPTPKVLEWERIVQEMRIATERARKGEGGSVLEFMTYRLSDHTTADDARRYRDDAEVKAGWEREPMTRLRTWLTAQGAWSEADEATWKEEYGARVDEEVNAYLNTPVQPVEAMFDYIYGDTPADVLAQPARVEQGEHRPAHHGQHRQRDAAPVGAAGRYAF